MDNKYAPAMRKAVSEADLITLNIGGNDWGSFLGWHVYEEMDKQEANSQFIAELKKYLEEGNAADPDGQATIDAIIGKDYDKNNAHAAEGSTDAVTTGLKGATLVLDATPAIRFYLADGADASAYKFYVGGDAVATVMGTDTTGAYIEIDVNAYKMCETVTYTVNGTDGGSYHIASYYKYASEGTDATLTSLVDRLWKYFQSARAYRNATV
jgi:hypothetical protein